MNRQMKKRVNEKILTDEQTERMIKYSANLDFLNNDR